MNCTTMGGCGSKEDSPRNKTYLLQTCDEHEAGINAMAVAEDGSVVVTASEDRTARIWTSGSEFTECVGILRGHEDYINCVQVEENYVITGSADKTVRKWNMASCECVHIYKGHSGLINKIISTGDFIFSSSYDRTIRCWDFDTGECVRMFTGHKRGVYPLIYIPADEEEANQDIMDWDGNKDILISGSADYTAKAWSFETGKCIQTFKGHSGAVTCMTTDPAGNVLFTGSMDCKIRSWKIRTGSPLKLFEGHRGSVICLSVSM